MPSTRRAQCTEDCRCVLCRELKGCKMSANGVEVQQKIGHEGANFILRRAVPFLPKPPAREEWREVARHDDYERSSTLEDRSRRGGNDGRDLKPWTPSNDIAKPGRDTSHKTVIYFGDSNPRPKEDKARQQQLQQPPPLPPSPPAPPPPPLPEACVQVTSRRNEDSETSLHPRNDETEARPRDASEREEDAGRRDSAMENGDPKAAHEIVVNVSPSREDVLRIEEDETQLEDYWSLPGDTSGFKADWSFVQQWRLRGPGGGNSREIYCPSYSKDFTENSPKSGVHDMVHMIPERDTDSVAPTPTPQHPRHSQHHHLSLHELRALQRRPECTGNSSSDENRSSGHASMSDTGGHTSSSSPPHRHHRAHSPQQLNAVPEDDRLSASVTQRNGRSRSGQNRNRHRATPAKLQVPWSGSGLEDIKLAIQQLTMRSHKSSSTYSSLSGSESSEPAVRRLMRHSSLETINTNVTSADEFVWVDSHNRLVELQQLPWTHHDVLRVLQNGRTREHMEQVSMETIPRLSYLLQRALVRIGRETQRLAKPIGLCSKHEVYSAFKIVLCPALADSCTKACLRAAAMFAVSGDQLKQSKASRSGLQLPVGRFLRWMSDVRLGRMIHEYAAIYLTAGIENLLEEILLQCVPTEPHTTLTATMLEHAIANSGDLWGLLQPYAHLNAGRTASGALAMPRWASVSSLNSSSSSRSGRDVAQSALEPSLLTTCVGSMSELIDLISKVAQAGRCPIPLTMRALHALFYYMRCSQLEHGERGSGIQELAYERAYVVLPPLVEWLRVAAAHTEHRHGLVMDQDDINQAARLLLPGVDCPVRPISSEEIAVCSKRIDDAEYVRLLTLDMAFKMLTSGRTDLIAQAMSLLPSTKINTVNDAGFTALMLACVNGDESAVMALLDAGADLNIESPPPTTSSSSNTPSKIPQTSGISNVRSPINQSAMITPNKTMPNANVASNSPNGPGGAIPSGICYAQTAFNAETQHWTALTYTALLGHCNIARILLERGAAVEGGAKLSEDKCTVTPLQAATGSGNNEMVALLLAHGAQPFLSTLIKDSFSYSGSVQRGCYSAISVATAHGQRSCLHQLLSHPLNFSAKRGEKEILSLEEILAEGNAGNSQQQTAEGRGARREGKEPVFNKIQTKALQEAMYHSAESNHLDITMELRGLKVGWTLHCWMHSLATAHEMRLDSVIDQLLQDFLQVCPDDYSTQFVQECLPLLFNIFRYSKKEGTTLLLADIFCTCFGWEPIKPIRDTTLSSGSRIDPKFVNNPELSDVQFRVEGRVFYGHKIVLVTSSPRFRNMLSSKLCEGNPPIVQINDIRYHIFQMVMEFLYHGGCATLEVNQSDVLELMAAANFFQLDGLLRYCEAQCSTMVDLDNIVSMYIHAKVYNAAQLLEYCQGFLLQNMVALLTYDDSVKRLLFAKKLPNHDVLAGLLLTLQSRIKARRSQQQNKIKA
ncbi:ankyrin repeat and BTB/POZ domain-containing protein BTBD11 isoform X1 [Temnothorax curvispinosus]|uniref:Ankyrin repeat and BTB/POZ domain-containing protein BTBD11 isoform X1 n=2 Tax=Temnothorax curvispinosus TaxID=300111 RepID=A0A6J1PDQ4_9HYME|nr:ankyrin repeat and BTB/POZ domain-containing protein BTBD11 isoform X1 [Temnothorax curvispinosus]XP_024867396.1 ankyrin repeat and BTB/POZ domain-containing protein BTBD11 isoform X1 [Temnothorax curvispinosus]XP_024867397.1 ankyrin repeat and BTB/POZ domain-containing protein BTBD11 isoform X1 [Temnothorax curvispinosus]XP_024867398.1 ankyrin repeat and BTB/POZ domain-containing protein BTBD11 isoform X1 [Temnothorax curvispinosus]